MLTDAQCRNATCPPGKKRARLNDAGGLYLEISPAGAKRWFYKFQQAGKETRLAVGSYPAVSLQAARAARDAAKLKKLQGVDPIQDKKLAQLKSARSASDTFKGVALEWHTRQTGNWSPVHAQTVHRRLERDLFPMLGHRSMQGIKPLELLSALQQIEQRGAIETAHRVLDIARQVWTYWLPTVDDGRDITTGLKGKLKPFRSGVFAAVTEPKRLGELMRAIKGYKGGMVVRTALQLTPLVFQRPGNLRSMKWEHLDLAAGLWTIPSAELKRTKAEKECGEPLVIPLARQAVTLLEAIKPYTGRGVFVFPSERNRDRPLSDGGVRAALFALGFGEEQKPHGFRATARTLLVDELGLEPALIEAHLAHGSTDRLGRSYNRTQYLKQRTEMAQAWANYLDKLAQGAEVIEFRAA